MTAEILVAMKEHKADILRVLCQGATYISKLETSSVIPDSGPTDTTEQGPPGEAEDGCVKALNHYGVRILNIDRRYVLALWRELDGEEIRNAIKDAGVGGLPIVYLDDPGLVEKVESHKFLQLHSELPIALKNQKRLARTRPDARGISLVKWKADRLSRLFQQQGKDGQVGRTNSQ
jgi:hypothetical protein